MEWYRIREGEKLIVSLFPALRTVTDPTDHKLWQRPLMTPFH